jgi:hypothetical protein
MFSWNLTWYDHGWSKTSKHSVDFLQLTANQLKPYDPEVMLNILIYFEDHQVMTLMKSNHNPDFIWWIHWWNPNTEEMLTLALWWWWSWQTLLHLNGKLESQVNMWSIPYVHDCEIVDLMDKCIWMWSISQLRNDWNQKGKIWGATLVHPYFCTLVKLN